MRRFRATRRVRLVVALIAGVVVIAVSQAFLPIWIATVVGLVVSAVTQSAFESLGGGDVVRHLTGHDRLLITVEHDETVVGEGWIVAVPGELLGEETRPPIGSTIVGAHGHLLRHDGYDVGTSHVRLTAQNTSPGPVSITAIEPVIVAREPPIADVRVRSVTAGAYELTSLRVRLDDDRPRLRDGRRDYFKRHAVSLAPGESHVFEIAAEATKAAYRWEFELQYNAGGSIARIRAPAQQLRTTVAADQYARSYEWVWYETPQRLEPRSATNARWP